MVTAVLMGLLLWLADLLGISHTFINGFFLLASIVNIFLASSALQFAISVIGAYAIAAGVIMIALAFRLKGHAKSAR